MIRNVPAYCKQVALRLLVMLGMYEISRIIYYIYNYHYFSSLTFGHVLYYLFVGLRFDISAIILTNVPFALLSIIPFGKEDGIYRKYVVRSVYMVVNSFALFTQFGDTVFFPYVYKRSTADIFKFLSLGHDTANVMPTVLKDFWYILVIWGALVLLMGYLYSKVGKNAVKPVPKDRPYIVATFLAYILTFGLLLLGYRGGLQLKPLSIIDAAEYSPTQDIPLVINTPFSIIKTYDTPPLKQYHFFPDNKLPSLYNTHYSGSLKTPRKINIVNIILESFSKEYIGALNNLHETNTPFLDSLISQSLVMDDAYSDGKRSIEGIPAVVAGLPSWMDTPYITSNYNSDNPMSLPKYLAKLGYRSAFFHGGNNGTMGFTAFCKEAGFDYYYGRTEYNNDKDYDGNWGIWDEPFFQYFAKNLDTLHQPFYAAIFSLSSHHPFSIPDKYKDRFVQKGNEMPILKCVRYSDMALKEFFKTASHQPWFDSTLFVITADHAGPSVNPYYTNRLGMYEIPIIFYMHNSNLKARCHEVAQHADILPSVLDYIHYPYPYFAFGKSVFDTTEPHYAVNYINDCYQLVKAPYCLQIEGKKTTALYDYKSDSMLNHNLITEKPLVRDSLAKTLEAIMQTYSEDIIDNKLHVNAKVSAAPPGK